MQPDFTQPHGSPIPPELVSEILGHAPGGAAPGFTLVSHLQFSNDVAVARLEDGRALVVKRGRYDWSARGFETSRAAAGLLRGAGITAPHSLDLPASLGPRALDAYWRIELPTLAELWPALGAEERRGAMRSLGRLLRRVHRTPLGDDGVLGDAPLLSQGLAEDLGGRLMPAVQAAWPEGVPLVDVLLGTIPQVVQRAGEPVLLHGDLHTGNVLCERAETVECRGLLDLECAHTGPRESDLARLAVMHSTLFQMHIEEPWLGWVLEGYEDPADPALITYYAVYHLVQLGLHSAWLGHGVHAAEVAAAARSTIAASPGFWRGGAAALIARHERECVSA